MDSIFNHISDAISSGKYRIRIVLGNISSLQMNHITEVLKDDFGYEILKTEFDNDEGYSIFVIWENPERIL